MDARLLALIHDYRAAVAVAVELLEAAGIPRPSSAMDWTVYEGPGRGPLPGGGEYNIHGFGCRVSSPTVQVDFDFGIEGQIDGFDWSRLCSFAGNRLTKRYGISDESELRSLFDDACHAGELTDSGYILWYLVETTSDEC